MAVPEHYADLKAAASFLHATAARWMSRLCLIVAVVIVSSTCATPTDAPGPPGGGPSSPPPSPPPGSPPPPSHWEGTLQLSGPVGVLVNESALLTLTARDAGGRPLVLPPVEFLSSDQGVAEVSADGVVTGRARGMATITARVDTASAAVTIEVSALLELVPAPVSEWARYISPSVGDTVQLQAYFVDVNGVRYALAPVSSWVSSNPAALSVSPEGMAIALLDDEVATITAFTPEGPVTRDIVVGALRPPTPVQLAHGALDVGPITFRIHGLPDVTLNAGEVAEVMVTSGTIYVATEGIPVASYSRGVFVGSPMIGASTLSLYAVSGLAFSGLVPAWSSAHPIPVGHGLVRLVQGSTLPVAYFRATGEPVSGLAELCYFDPGDQSSYYARPAGGFDLLMQNKLGYAPNPTLPVARLPVTVVEGKAMTLVLTGSTASNASYVAFLDP